MGVAEEKLVMEFLGHGHGREMDVDAIVAMMTDDVVFSGQRADAEATGRA